jgi:hypothetical protein
MASLRTVPRDESERADRVSELRALAPIPATKLARRVKPSNFQGANVFVTLMAALIGATWVAPLQALQASAEAIAWIEADLNASGQAITTTILVAAAGLALTIAWGRATALCRPIKLPSGGRVTVNEVAAQLRSLILQADAVREADVQVDNLHRNGVRVATRLHVASHADLNRTVEVVFEQTEWFLHAHLLVRLSSIPSVELSFDELDLRVGRVHDGRAHAAGG